MGEAVGLSLGTAALFAMSDGSQHPLYSYKWIHDYVPFSIFIIATVSSIKFKTLTGLDLEVIQNKICPKLRKSKGQQANKRMISRYAVFAEEAR